MAVLVGAFKNSAGGRGVVAITQTVRKFFAHWSWSRLVYRKLAGGSDQPFQAYPLGGFCRRPRVYVDLAPYLGRFAKKDSEGAALRTPFRVYCGHGKGRQTSFRDIYHDTDYSFILVRNNMRSLLARPGTRFLERMEDAELACIGFSVKMGRVSIEQIQGVQGRGVDLKPIKWERMLVAFVVDWARAQGFKIVEVLPGRKNGWYSKEREKQFYVRYDVTAQRLGFAYTSREMYELML